jgi:lipoprotein-releasing system permease protein
VGDKFNTFMKEGENKLPNSRRLLSWEYLIGFQEFDATYIMDIRHIQRINKWKPDQIEL